MARHEPQTNKAKESPSSLIPPEFAAVGKKGLEELLSLPTEEMEKLQEMNRHWLDRMQSESKLVSEFAAKLTAARSIPEVATAYQEWASRQMEMTAEDAKRIFADAQKLAETGARLLSNGWRPNDHGAARNFARPRVTR